MRAAPANTAGTSSRLTALDVQRETFLVQIAPFLRYASEDSKNVTKNLDLAVADHWTDLIHCTNVGVEISQSIPLKETLLVMSRRIAALEEGRLDVKGKKKVGSSVVTGPSKGKKRESVWNESLFHLKNIPQVLTVASHLHALREDGKRGQVLAEVVESECRYLNDLLVIKGVYEAALREQSKRAKPFISEDEIDTLFPESLTQVISVHESLFGKLSNFASANDLMGPILAEFAVACVRAYLDYIVGFEKMNEKLKDMVAKRPLLADFLRSCKDHPQCNQRDLISLLVMPVQHVPKLQLLIEEATKKTPDDHVDKKELANALKAVSLVGQRINTEKGKSDDFDAITELCSNKFLDSYIVKVLMHPSQKALGRRHLQMFKLTRLLGETRDEVRCFLFSDVLVVAQKKGRSDKLTVVDYLWLCDAAPVVPLTYNKMDCFLLEASASKGGVLARDVARDTPPRIDFSMLVDCTDLEEDHREEFRMCVNNAVANCINAIPPVVESLSDVQVTKKIAVLKDDSASSSPIPSRFSTLRGKQKTADVLPGVVASDDMGSGAAAAARAEPPSTASPSAAAAVAVAAMAKRGAASTTPAAGLSRLSQGRLEPTVVAPATISAKPSTGSSGLTSPKAQNVPSAPPVSSPPDPTADSPGMTRKKPRPHTSKDIQPLKEVQEIREEEVNASAVKSPTPSRGAAFRDKISQALRGGGTIRGATTPDKSSKVFGISLAKLWESKASVPTIVVDCVAEIELRGLATEGIFRVPGSGDVLKLLKKQYDSNEPVNLAEWDVNTIASLLLLWIRELPEPLLPTSSWAMLRSAMDVSTDEMRAVICRALPVPNLAIIAQVLRLCKTVALSESVNKMSSENLAVCLTPDLVRSEGDAMHDLKTSGQVGPVIRYLIDNAGEIFPRLAFSPRGTGGGVGGDSVDGDDDMGDEGLTVSAELQAAATPSASGGGAEKKGLKLPWGRSGGNKEKSTTKGTSKKRPKDLSFPSTEPSGLGEVIASEDHVGETDELRFKVGDVIIIDQLHPSGWWYGRCQGNAGIFPSAKTNAGGIVRPSATAVASQSLKNSSNKVPGIQLSPRVKKSGLSEDKSPKSSPRSPSSEEDSSTSAPAIPQPSVVVHSPVVPALPPKPRANSDTEVKRPVPKFAQRQGTAPSTATSSVIEDASSPEPAPSSGPPPIPPKASPGKFPNAGPITPPVKPVGAKGRKLPPGPRTSTTVEDE